MTDLGPPPGKELSIEDFDTNRLLNNIKTQFQKAKGVARQDANIFLDEVYVVGSLARGEARENKSDVDIFLVFASTTHDELDPDFNLVRTEVATLLSTNERDVITDEMRDSLVGVDVLDGIPRNKTTQLLNFYSDSRTGEDFGDNAVYDLEEKRHVPKLELQRP